MADGPAAARVVENAYYQFRLTIPDRWLSRNDLRAAEVFRFARGRRRIRVR